MGSLRYMCILSTGFWGIPKLCAGKIRAAFRQDLAKALHLTQEPVGLFVCLSTLETCRDDCRPGYASHDLMLC